MNDYNEIINFWFSEIKPHQWWEKREKFDLLINTRFGQYHHQAKQGDLVAWRETPLGSLAEIIILDQFSRNIHRGKAESFSHDPMALALAQLSIAKGFDQKLNDTQRIFLYMPFMHSESKLIHVEAVKLFESIGIQNNLAFEYKHKAIIDQFGRYPHRNQILGRESTEEELAFLKEKGSSF